MASATELSPFNSCFRRLISMAGWLSLIATANESTISAQSALTPSQEVASFHVADRQLIVELIAAEPDVVSPVAIAFDADGRLFVAEMIDYPNGPMSGRIRLLEDRDHDGRYEAATVFADSLPFPNSVLPWNGGVLVTAAPNIWFLKDTNGDQRADERRVLFSGFGAGNQQLRVNGLTWGLDSWVYGANGRSDGEVRGDNLPKPVSLRGHDFRFRPETGEFEAIAGRSQFGLARDDWGNRFLSWNTIAIRHEVLPERYLSRNPNLASTESVFDIAPSGETGRVFPLTPPPLTFNNESVKNFNALAGLTIYRGDALGEGYQGNAFMGESLLNLVHRRILEPDGVTFVAKRGEMNQEFLASSDPWFHAVNFATGPDGALYVVDFYRRFVEHPEFVRGKARNEVGWREGAEHGRIWRIRNPKIKPRARKPELSKASSANLVKHFDDANGWWRDTAQRLIIERQDRAVIPALEKMARKGSSPLARLHALYTLDGLNALKAALLVAALRDPHPRVREHAIRLSEPLLTTEHVPEPLTKALMRLGADPDRKLLTDMDSRVRFQLALSLGQLEDSGKLDTLATVARWDFASRWHSLAILSSLGSASWPFLKGLLQDDYWSAGDREPVALKAAFLERVARLVASHHNENEVSECLTLLTGSGSRLMAAHVGVLAGLGDGLAGSGQTLRQLIEQPSAKLAHQHEALLGLIKLIRDAAPSARQTIPMRLLAIRVLARATPELSSAALLDLLQPELSADIQAAAAVALADLDDPASDKMVFSRWSQYSAATRRRILSALSRSGSGAIAIADALEQGNLSAVELDASLRQTLLKKSDPQLKGRFKPFLESGASDRSEVVHRFEPALKLNGDRLRGAALFAKTCLLCHTVEGQGRQVGPDLSAVASRPPDSLLADILDPSRQVSPDFINYILTTTDRRTVTGFIYSETATSVTLRRAGEPDETVLRREIKELRAEGKSLMPEGLEQGLTPQDLADLLSFLQKPEARLLPRD